MFCDFSGFKGRELCGTEPSSESAHGGCERERNLVEEHTKCWAVLFKSAKTEEVEELLPSISTPICESLSQNNGRTTMSCYEAVLWSSRAHVLVCEIKPKSFQLLGFLQSQSELDKSVRKKFENKIEENVFHEVCEDRNQRLRPPVCWEDRHLPTREKTTVRT